MEETVSFLKSLLATHGPNYFERLFGPKARNNMLELGGVDNVAIVLSGELAITLYTYTITNYILTWTLTIVWQV